MKRSLATFLLPLQDQGSPFPEKNYMALPGSMHTTIISLVSHQQKERLVVSGWNAFCVETQSLNWNGLKTSLSIILCVPIPLQLPTFSHSIKKYVRNITLILLCTYETVMNLESRMYLKRKSLGYLGKIQITKSPQSRVRPVQYSLLQMPVARSCLL